MIRWNLALVRAGLGGAMGSAAFSLLVSLGCAASSGANGTSSSSDPPASSSGSSRREACSGVDFASDPKHCGACDHDCFGGGCSEGRCTEALLYESSQSCSVVAGGGFVWIGDPNRGIVVLPTEGEGTPREVVPPKLEKPSYVLQYGQDALYWNEQTHRATDPVPTNRKIFRTTIDGATRPVLSLVDESPGGGGEQLAYGFGVTRDDVYLYRPRALAVAVLMRVDTASGRASDVATLSGVNVTESLATHGERVAFFDVGLDVPQGRIGIIDGPGKTPRWIHPQERKGETRSSQVMALDAEAVYAVQPAASTSSNWEIRRIPLAGGPTSVVIDTNDDPSRMGMVQDATHYYVLVTKPGQLSTDPRRARLIEIAKEGGASTTLLDVEGWAQGLAYDGKSVYVVTEDPKDTKHEGSRIYRLRVTKG